MSSPIHHSDDLDPALRYAPRRVREQASGAGRRLPLPPDFRRPQRARPEFSGDRAMVELQRQLLLDPDAIPEPLVDDARTLKPIVLRLAGVLALAALIAWCIVSLPNMKKTGAIMSVDVKMPAISGAPVNLVVPQPAKPASQTGQSVLTMSEPAAPPAPTPAKTVVASLAPVTPVPEMMQPPSLPPTMVPPRAQAAPAVPTNAPVDAAPPQIDAAELIAMIKRGKDLLASGDIVSARLVLRRAADAGSAEAALALGATFDPLVIRSLGAVGMAPDVAQAKQWYQRAADLGSAAAMGQLAKLEQTR